MTPQPLDRPPNSSERQEHLMRWILFATIQVSALGSTIAALIYGPSPWMSVSACGLIWLARRLFGPTRAAGRRDALERTSQTD